MAYRYRRHLTRRRLRRLLGRRWRKRRQARALAAVAAAGLTLVILTHGHHTTATTPAPAPVPGPAPAAAQTGPPASSGGNVALGQRLAASYGWGVGAQWDCLYALWQRESGWNNTAINTQSGAYGIAQALGHGPTNQYPPGPANPPTSSAFTQISWGLGYIATRYGSPCTAWAHETADGWY